LHKFTVFFGETDFRESWFNSLDMLMKTGLWSRLADYGFPRAREWHRGQRPPQGHSATGGQVAFGESWRKGPCGTKRPLASGPYKHICMAVSAGDWILLEKTDRPHTSVRLGERTYGPPGTYM